MSSLSPRPGPPPAGPPIVRSPAPRLSPVRPLGMNARALLAALLLGAGGPVLAQTAPVQTTPIQTTPLPDTAAPATSPVQVTPIQTTPLQVTPSQIAPAPAVPAPTSPVAVPAPAETAPTPAVIAPALAAPTFTFQQALASLTASAQYRQLQLTLQAAQVQAQTAQASTGVTAGVSGTLGYASGSSTDSSGVVSDTSSLSGTVVASASLPVLPWATANLNAQAAARTYAVAQVSFAQNVAFLKTNLELAYGRAVTAQLNLSIARNSLTLSQRQLAQVTAFQANNNATVQSVQAAQSAAQTAAVAVVSAQNELGSARRALGTLVGQDLSAAVLNTDLSAEVTGVALPSQQAALVGAQAFSPLLASARRAVTDAQVAVQTAERNRRLPATSVNASYGPGSSSARSGLSTSLNVQTGLLSASYTQPVLGGSGAGGGASFALGLSASFNVLDPAADGALKLAQVQLQQAQTAVTVQEDSVAQTLVDAYSAAQVAAQSIAARASSVTAYTTALATSRARLTAGLATETEVLNAEIALAQAARDLNSAQVLALTTAAQLSGLTGLSGAP
ncbi:TolC family protein [Deinococcus altitudinis]|uniref:TolC family protein n=1 Tax=Deinococcus altitudinis TaxID=468914 RepID=UPI0038920E0B